MQEADTLRADSPEWNRVFLFAWLPFSFSFTDNEARSSLLQMFFLKISQYLQEHTCVGVCKVYKYCESYKNNFFYRTAQVGVRFFKATFFQWGLLQLVYFVFCNYRSSNRRCFVRKGVLRNFAKFTGKHLCQSFFLTLFFFFRSQACNFIKKRLWHRRFPVSFQKFLRTPFSRNTSGRLLL